MNASYQVERIGGNLENFGFSPIVSRVLALLMVSEPPHQSFYQIQEFLNASKSAISYALNYLLNENIIEAITFPGDRKRYFRMSLDSWVGIIRKKIMQIINAGTVFDDLKNIKQKMNPDESLKYEELLDLLSIIQKNLNIAIDEWSEERTKVEHRNEFNRLINKSR